MMLKLNTYIYFQQDGTTCHGTAESMDYEIEIFDLRILSRNTGFPCQARSCNLTPYDFFVHLSQK